MATWHKYKIKEIGEVITGSTPSTIIDAYWGGPFPFVTPTDFSDSKYLYNTERKVTQKGLDQGRKIPKNAVMVTCIASIGEVSLSTEECITNQQINSIVCNENVDPNYLYYYFIKNKIALKRAAGITTSPIIKKSQFENLEIPLPPLPVQRKIAEILSTADAAIEKVDQAIAATERLKKGLMQQLLTKGIGHTQFKNTELGRIPKEWEVVRLGDVCDLIDGDWILRENYSTCGIRLLQVGDIGLGEFIGKSNRYISVITADKLGCTIVKPLEDILISRMPDPIGRSCLAPKLKCPYIVAVDISICKVNKTKLYNKYIVDVLNSDWVLKRIWSYSAGATRTRISRSNLENIKLAISNNIDEQKQISNIIESINNKKLEQINTRTSITNIKQSLMSDLLTGKRSIKV